MSKKVKAIAKSKPSKGSKPPKQKKEPASAGKVFRFRVLIESEEEDVIREIEIMDNCTFEDFHDNIKKAFNFSGKQLASFYLSDDEWEKGTEIALVPMEVEAGSEEEDVKVMSETKLNAVVKKNKTKLLYVFDFLVMWTFYVELVSISDPEKRAKYPRCVKKTGKAPSQNSKKAGKLDDEEEELLKELKTDRKGRDVFSDEIFEGFDDFEDGFNDLEDMDGFSEIDKF